MMKKSISSKLLQRASRITGYKEILKKRGFWSMKKGFEPKHREERKERGEFHDRLSELRRKYEGQRKAGEEEVTEDYWKMHVGGKRVKRKKL